MGSADFRLNGRIFATLAYGAKELATLKLTPEQQAGFLNEGSEYFWPAPGGWGRMGMTLVRLDAPKAVLAGALLTAYHNLSAKLSVTKAPPLLDSPAAKAVPTRRKRKAGASATRLQ